MDIAGLMAATSILPPPKSCTITLHGSMVPILSSAINAWCASGGIARAEDPIVPKIDVELFLHRLFDIDFGQNTKSFGFE